MDQIILNGERKSAPVVLHGWARILVMDDDLTVREITEAILRQLGYEVELAGNGEDAVMLYDEAKQAGRPFDLVMLDLNVRGGMGGMEAMDRLLRIYPDVKAIVLSGYSRDPVIVNYARYGFKAALPKPYPLTALREALFQVLGR